MLVRFQMSGRLVFSGTLTSRVLGCILQAQSALLRWQWSFVLDCDCCGRSRGLRWVCGTRRFAARFIGRLDRWVRRTTMRSGNDWCKMIYLVKSCSKMIYFEKDTGHRKNWVPDAPDIEHQRERQWNYETTTIFYMYSVLLIAVITC